jgi:hypothetical protein
VLVWHLRHVSEMLTNQHFTVMPARCISRSCDSRSKLLHLTSSSQYKRKVDQHTFIIISKLEQSIKNNSLNMQACHITFISFFHVSKLLQFFFRFHTTNHQNLQGTHSKHTTGHAATHLHLFIYITLPFFLLMHPLPVLEPSPLSYVISPAPLNLHPLLHI